MTTALAEISEKAAIGEIASIYADIRRTIGLPLVNLIFRHMATIPDCLEWTWENLKPLYSHDAIYAAAGEIAAGVSSSPAGVERPWQKDPVVADTLESYTRGNMLNMIALFFLERAGARGGSENTLGEPFTPRNIATLLPLPDLTSIPPDDMARLRALTRRTEGNSPIVPSLFRHFAQWPEAIAAIDEIVGELTRNGRLENLASAMMDTGRKAAAEFPAPALPDGVHILPEIKRLSSLFPPTMARMTILATAMRQP